MSCSKSKQTHDWEQRLLGIGILSIVHLIEINWECLFDQTCEWWVKWTHCRNDLERLLTDDICDWIASQNIDDDLREVIEWVNRRSIQLRGDSMT